MGSSTIEELRTRFNEAIGTVRVITFVSPTCGPCRYGQGVVRALFEEFPDERLTGFIVWVPMLPADNVDSATAEQKAITDPRLRCWYDADRDAANAWSAFIGLTTTTWDVYAVYDPTASWPNDEAPPRPQIWMHQLNDTAASRLADRLEPAKLAREWLQLIGGDAGRQEQLALTLHAKGQAVSARHDPAN